MEWYNDFQFHKNIFTTNLHKRKPPVKLTIQNIFHNFEVSIKVLFPLCWVRLIKYGYYTLRFIDTLDHICVENLLYVYKFKTTRDRTMFCCFGKYLDNWKGKYSLNKTIRT